MFCQRRLSSGPPLTVITAILIFIIFVTKQAKDLYERNQKHHRMENYNEFEEFTHTVRKVLSCRFSEYENFLYALVKIQITETQISDVSSSMSALEVSVNKSSDALHQLMGVLQRHHRKHRPRRSRR